MPKLSDVVATERAHLESLECPTFEHTAFEAPKPLKDCKVALISSAGLMNRHDENIRGGEASYRSFPNTSTDRDLLINHISVNFDRSGFAADANTVFPRERLRQLADDGIIGTAAKEHYSFMGATSIDNMEEHVKELVSHLKENNVDAVCLLPV